MPDCGSNSCMYAKKRTGMRTNSMCRCDQCPCCNSHIKPTSPAFHRNWCRMSAWIPPHHRGRMGVKKGPIQIGPIQIGPIALRGVRLVKPLPISIPVKIEDDDATSTD